MGKFSVRFEDETENILSNIEGSTKNGKLEYLVRNYHIWQDEIQEKRKENRILNDELNQLKSLLKNKIMAEKQLMDFVENI